MDREGIRRLAAEELDLPTSPYAFCDSLKELRSAVDGGPVRSLKRAEAIGYPCVVKPVMSSSGKGQSKVDEPGALGRAWDHAMASGRVRGSRVIVEGFIAFEYEITLLTVCALGPDGSVHTSFCAPVGHVQAGGDHVESWQPHPMAPGALRRTQDIARTVTHDLGGPGVFGVELFVTGEDVWFSEVSSRPHDTGMMTMATQWHSEFDLHVRAILAYAWTRRRNPGASAVILARGTRRA